MTLPVYVAAPYSEGALVREMHATISWLGGRPTSRWAEQAIGTEDFSKHTPEELRAIAADNDADIAAADVTLLYDPAGIGREAYADARYALLLERAVVWCSPRGISGFRAGVARVHDLSMAASLGLIIRMQRLHAEGIRGRLLADLAAAEAAEAVHAGFVAPRDAALFHAAEERSDGLPCGSTEWGSHDHGGES